MNDICCNSKSSEASESLRKNKKEKKTSRNVDKVKRNLFKLGINPLDSPSKCVVVGNAGHGTGWTEEQLLKACQPYGPVEGVLMVPGMAYCFVVFADPAGAAAAREALHGRRNPVSASPGVLYLLYVEAVSGYSSMQKFDMKPPGLFLFENFVDEAEEETLLRCVKWTSTDCHSGKMLKQRRVKHYGYEFNYDTNNVDKDCPLREGIPPECDIIWPRLEQRGCKLVGRPADQLTVNHYEPGHGIPQHVDTHSAFEDPILSLSLGASVVMEFKHPDGRHASVLLPRRSLLVMSGEARYAWSHGITARKTDIVPSVAGGLVVRDRCARTSFTFRNVRQGECDCQYHEQCDSHQRGVASAADPASTDQVAARLESLHVQQVYEEIAGHFSETRHKPWPNVLAFVQAMPPGSLLLDVGCGNGKYFGHNKTIFELGCDTSVGLARVCEQRGFQVLNANCLHLPFKSGFADGCISIAVIHHLASRARRLRAVEEIVRILRPGGRALIYVWSKNQERDMEKSVYLRREKSDGLRVRKSSAVMEQGNDDVCTSDGVKAVAAPVKTAGAERTGGPGPCGQEEFPRLPIHTNRTQFKHQDVFVPWIMKPSKHTDKQTLPPMFYRYYHVFEEGELEELCGHVGSCVVTKHYYDQGNWCVVLQKLPV